MKKGILYYMALWILLFCCIRACAVGTDESLVLRSNDEYVAVSDGDVIWFADEEGVWKSGGQQENVCVKMQRGIAALASDGGDVFIVYDADGIWLECIDSQGVTINKWSIPVQEDVLEVEILGDTCAVLTNTGFGSRLSFFNMKDGYMYPFDEAREIGAIAKGAGDSLLISFLGYMQTYRVVPGADQAELVAPLDGLVWNDLFEYEDGSFCIAVAHEHELEIWNVSRTGKAKHTDNVLMSDEMFSVVQVLEDKILYREGEKLYSYVPAQDRIDAQITIYKSETLMPDLRMDAAISMFEQMHPDVEVRVGTGEMEDIVLSLMSGDDTYDILWLTYLEQSVFDRAGLLADIGNYPDITKELESWLHVSAMYDEEGILRCIPTEMQEIWLWYQIDPSAFDETGISLPEGGNTFDTVGELFSQARGKGFYFLGDRDDLQYPFAHYITGLAENGLPYVFDTHQFRQMLSFWKESYDAGELALSAQLRSETRTDVLVTPFTKAFGAKIDPLAWITAGDFMFMPSVEGDALVPVEMNALFLYEYGKNKDVSSQFLACYASADVQKRIEMPSKNLFLRDLTVYPHYEMWTQVIPQLGYALVDADGYTHWAEVMGHTCQMPGDGELYITANEMHGQYLRGDADADDVISVLNEKADILLNE